MKLFRHARARLCAGLLCSSGCACAGCGDAPLALQVLGSGGPELQAQRASSAYLLWIDGRARVLVDAGGGSAMRFDAAGARFSDLDAVVLTHLHVDHSADLPVLVKASYFGERDRELAVYGPSGNELMPNVGDFLDALFGQQSEVYPYLSDYLGQGGAAAYQLHAVEVGADQRKPVHPAPLPRVRLTAVGVHHGPVPALAWRVEAAGASVVFSGDMNGDYRTLPTLAQNADLLVAHHAVTESARGAARDLHMPPSLIGRIAQQAKVKKLILSHRMRRTLGHEHDSLDYIRASYQGPVEFANDLDCFLVAGAPRDTDAR